MIDPSVKQPAHRRPPTDARERAPPSGRFMTQRPYGERRFVVRRERRRRGPLGPGETWKSGQRVERSGVYVDQYGVESLHLIHSTFPPCIGRKGEGALRRLVRAFPDHYIAA